MKPGYLFTWRPVAICISFNAKIGAPHEVTWLILDQNLAVSSVHAGEYTNTEIEELIKHCPV